MKIIALAFVISLLFFSFAKAEDSQCQTVHYKSCMMNEGNKPASEHGGLKVEDYCTALATAACAEAKPKQESTAS